MEQVECIWALSLIELANPKDIELFVVVSEGEKAVALSENGQEVSNFLTPDRARQSRDFRIYDEDELDSGISIS